MRLRNKKTGKVYTLSNNLFIEYTQGGRIELRVIIPGGNMSYYYDSLDKLNEEWEDYKPAEPLIKDEKIRKAVRAWAEANVTLESDEIKKVFYDADEWELRAYECGEARIQFNRSLKIGREDKEYTIEELCGEEG